MTSLDISNNNIVATSSWMKPPRQGLKRGDNVDGKTVTSIAGDGDIKLTDFSGVVALADGIKNNGALTSLNLASNELEAEGAKHVAEAIKVNVSALRFDWHHFELDLTSGSTAVVYGYSCYNTAPRAGRWRPLI